MKPYTHLTLEERESLAKMYEQGEKPSHIAKALGRSVSTITRELKRNYSQKRKRYNAWRATTLYILRRRRCRRKLKLQVDVALCQEVISKLEQYWSPEIIAARCEKPISHATIYRAIATGILPGIKKKTHLRRRGKQRPSKKTATITPRLTIHDRPECANLKERIGDLEGDTVYGAVGKGGLVTLTDRKLRLLLAKRILTRDSAEVKATIDELLEKAPIPCHSLTLDRGSEFALHEKYPVDVYFCDPHAPWQRGLNENTNDVLRFFFPKGTDFTQVTDEQVDEVVYLINARPRKCLDFLSPLEILASKCCT